MPIDKAQIAALLKSTSKKKKGKKGRKIGRSKRHPAAQRYLFDRRWLTNKVRRMRRYIRQFPNDFQAASLLNTFLDNHRELK